MIAIEAVSKWYGSQQVLRECSATVAAGETIVIRGPSGSGKSTLIKCVNGLERCQEGSITIQGVGVQHRSTDLPRLRSRIGMVFQSFELFPHMTELGNVSLGG